MQYIKNEWIKIWSQKSTWIMLIILLGLVSIVAGISKYFDVDSSTKEVRLQENEKLLNQYNEWLSEEGIAEEDKLYYNEEIAKLQYRIDNDLPSPDTVTFTEQMELSITISVALISIFAIVVAAGIISSEFSSGTIKMLLTRPVARWKILLSKLATTILFSLALLAVSLAFSALLDVLLFGTEKAVTLSILDGQVVAQEVENTYLENIPFSFASLLMTIIFAFMIGSLFSSSTLAVSLSLFILLMGQTATLFISQYNFAKYIWFANDIGQFGLEIVRLSKT